MFKPKPVRNVSGVREISLTERNVAEIFPDPNKSRIWGINMGTQGIFVDRNVTERGPG